MPKKSFKRRVLLNIAGAIIMATVVSTIVAYSYFTKVVTQQKVTEEQDRLIQLVNQLDFMVEDIESFGRSMAIDSALQEELNTASYENEFQRTKRRYETGTRLRFYNSLRTYIGLSAIKGANGEYYSSKPTYDNDYYKEKLQTPEFAEYLAQEDRTLSDPFESSEVETGGRVICYKMEIRDMNSSDKVLGELYFDINFRYFTKEIGNFANDYTDVMLLNGDGKIIFQKNSRLLEGDSLKLQSGENLFVQRDRDGYLIGKKLERTEWTVCTYISREYIWKNTNFVLRFFLLFFVTSISAILVITSGILENMIRPVTQLSEHMSRIEYDSMELPLQVHTGDEIETLYRQFDIMLKQIKTYMDERLEHEKQKKEMEFDILLSQINPHYLYNVLNTVVYLAAAEKNTRIMDIVNALIYTLQETLKLGDKNIYTAVEQELELVRCYLKIQEYRYPQMFEVRMRCDEDVLNLPIPKTIMQPLVENAIFHGIIPLDEPGVIIVEAYREKDNLILRVGNTGESMDASLIARFEKGEELPYQPEERKHIGLVNIRERIQYLYGAKGSIHIESSQDFATVVTIALPIGDEKAVSI